MALPYGLAMQLPYFQNAENGMYGLYSLILGCFGFPLGLFLICVVGADLFTSNCAYLLVSLHEGRTTLWHLVRVRGSCTRLLEHAIAFVSRHFEIFIH
jgi:formate/nitrite transporter FocA (FNT family)